MIDGEGQYLQNGLHTGRYRDHDAVECGVDKKNILVREYVDLTEQQYSL